MALFSLLHWASAIRLLKRLLLICCGVSVIGPIDIASELTVCSSAVLKNMQLAIMARKSVAMQVARRCARVNEEGLALMPTDSHMWSSTALWNMLLRTSAEELLAAVKALEGFRVRRTLPSDLFTDSQLSHKNIYLPCTHALYCALWWTCLSVSK